MIVRKFESASMEGALQLVKQELGPDALILSTENRKGGVFRKPSVEVTAAFVESPAQKAIKEFDEEQLEQVFPHRRLGKEQPAAAVADEEPPPTRRPVSRKTAGRVESAARPSGRAGDARVEVSATVRSLELSFLDAGLAPETAAEFAGRLAMDYRRSERQDPEFLTRIRVKCLAGSMRTLGPEVFDSRRYWAVVGTPGCGKTSVAVKLGISLRARKQNVSLVSGDRRKIVGRQELAAYAKLIRVPFATEVKADRSGARVQVIDTSSLTWYDAEGIGEVQRICRDCNTLLVLDASQRLSELLRTVSQAERLAPVALAFTRLDMVAQTGVIFEVLRAVKLPLLGASVSRSFTEPFRFFEPAELARYILGGKSPESSQPNNPTR
jgi:flagellar biosynthesis protein FlhF